MGKFDLSNKMGTVANVIRDNSEKFQACKTKADVIALCHKLFDDAGIDTEWTRVFFINLERSKSFFDALNYVYNCYQRGTGNGVIRPGRYYEESDEDMNEDYNGHASYATVKHLPGAVQKILDMRGEMKFDVAADDVEVETIMMPRAKQLGVVFEMVPDNYTYGRMTGRIGQMLKFIFMSAHRVILDKKFTDGIEYESALLLKIDPSDLRKVNPVEFTEFVDWMGKSYPDFVAGIKENTQLARFYREA